MERKPGHLALTGFVLLWFAVIVPGHQRGTLRLPGGDAISSCCKMKSGRMTVDHGEQQPRESTPTPVRDCAICQFTLTLDAPPLPDLFTPESQPLAILPVERTGRSDVEPLLDIWRERGPPI